MPILTHFAPEKSLGSISRSGIKAYPWASEKPHGVFCMPVLPNFMVTHQWLRELKRRGQRTILAIDFRLRSEVMIWFGHYGHTHAEISLGRAIGILMRTPDVMGWEVIVPRSGPTRLSGSASQARSSAGATSRIRTKNDRLVPAGCACQRG